MEALYRTAAPFRSLKYSDQSASVVVGLRFGGAGSEQEGVMSSFVEVSGGSGFSFFEDSGCLVSVSFEALNSSVSLLLEIGGSVSCRKLEEHPVKINIHGII